MLCLQLETFWAGRSDGPTCAPFAGPSTSQRRHGWRTGTWGKTPFLAIEGGRHNAGSKFLLKSESATSQRSPPVAPHARPLRRPPHFRRRKGREAGSRRAGDERMRSGAGPGRQTPLRMTAVGQAHARVQFQRFTGFLGGGLLKASAGWIGSSSQKQLPCWGVDSTPTFPFIFSTALATIARPIPVPG